jgi:hypothetical protein
MERHPVEDAEARQIAEIVDAEIARGSVDRPPLGEQVLGEQASVLARDAEDESGIADGPPRRIPSPRWVRVLHARRFDAIGSFRGENKTKPVFGRTHHENEPSW